MFLTWFIYLFYCYTIDLRNYETETTQPTPTMPMDHDDFIVLKSRGQTMFDLPV